MILYYCANCQDIIPLEEVEIEERKDRLNHSVCERCGKDVRKLTDDDLDEMRLEMKEAVVCPLCDSPVVIAMRPNRRGFVALCQCTQEGRRLGHFYSFGTLIDAARDWKVRREAWNEGYDDAIGDLLEYVSKKQEEGQQ